MNTIYTDGSCMNNGFENAKASWAIFHTQKKILLSGLVDESIEQTNNTGELMAVKKALALLHYLKDLQGLIITDSLYSINSLTIWDPEKKVKGQRKKNYHLIKEIREIMRGMKIDFRWVKGHSFDQHNDLVDRTARDCLY